MEQQYFIRIRGRVQGPFDRDYLRGLARRGQFGRLHEVSEDGTSWARAETIPELFAPAQTQTHSGSPAAETDTCADTFAVKTDQRPQSKNVDAASEWYYLIGSQQFGPVGREELVQLFNSGRLSRQTAVWTKGMQEWTRGDQVLLIGSGNEATPGVIGQTTEHGSERNSAAMVSERTFDALTRTQPWVLFVAILLMGYMSGLLIWGFVSFITGTKASSEALVGGGVGMLIGAGLICWLALLLLRYGSRINALKYSRRIDHLESALDAQRQFWGLLGMILAVALVVGVIGTITMMAAA
jgi:hypothetical protein